MSHIDMATGDLVADEGDGPDVSAYSPSLETLDGGQDYSPDPAYLQQILGSRNPEERASGMAGLNYTPSQADPNFHPFIQNLMTANEVQPQVDRMDAFRQMVSQQFPRQPDAVRQKTPPLAYILGGLQDALALGSMLRHPTKRQFYTGRHGRGGKPVMQTYYEQPQRVPTQIGGTATALFAPMIQQRQDQRIVDRQNFMRDQQIAAEMARYAGSAAMRPPAAPRESAVSAGYRTIKALAQETGHPEYVDAWVKWAAHADPKAKATLEQQAQDAKARGDKPTYDSIMGTIKDIATARQHPGTAPKTPEQIAAEAQARTTGNLQGQLGFAQQSGVLPPNVAASIKRARKPVEDKIAAAQRVLDALMKAKDKAVTEGQATMGLGGAVDTSKFDDQIRKQQQVIENLGWKAQQAEDQVRTNLGLSFDASQMSGIGTGQDQGSDMSSEDLGAATPAVPAGFDMQFSDGSHFSEWTEADWAKLRAHSPETYDQLVGEISASGQ